MAAAPDPGVTVFRRLMTLVEEGDTSTVGALLDGESVDLDVIDPASGLSPLQLAVDAAADAAVQTGQEPDLGMVRVLLRANADPSFSGPEGRTAAAIAEEYGWLEAARILRGDGS